MMKMSENFPQSMQKQIAKDYGYPQIKNYQTNEEYINMNFESVLSDRTNVHHQRVDSRVTSAYLN